MTHSKDQEILVLEKKIFLLESILHQIPISIYWKDMDGRYLGQNQFAANLMKHVKLQKGCTVETIVGKTDLDIFPEEAAINYRKNDLEVLHKKVKYQLKSKLRRHQAH